MNVPSSGSAARSPLLYILHMLVIMFSADRSVNLVILSCRVRVSPQQLLVTPSTIFELGR